MTGLAHNLQPNTVYESDRRCPHVDPETGEQCITVLCHLNPGPHCFIHSGKPVGAAGWHLHPREQERQAA